MRSAILPALIALAITIPAGSAARPPNRRPPSIPAARRGDPSARVVALRAPGPDAILVRAGAFTMGSSDAEIANAVTLCKLEPGGERCSDEIAASFSSESPEHTVYLSDFWIDRTEVTVDRYRRCVAAGVCHEPPYAAGGRRFDRADFPVVLVTWSDAAQFCAWAGGRLPTEAEWERAARGPSGRRYPWGNVYNPFHANHGAFFGVDDGDGFVELSPVGAFQAGRTPDGIDDLAGNADEWVADWYAPEYPAGSAKNPRGPDAGEERVVRGGSYALGRPWLRAAARGHDNPGVRRSWRGFRCVRSDRILRP